MFGVVAAALNLLHDWREAQVLSNIPASHETASAGRNWSKPPDGWLKVNCDASGAVNGAIGIGCVLQNSQGDFVGARCRKVEGSWNPMEAEAISLKEALAWARWRFLFSQNCF